MHIQALHKTSLIRNLLSLVLLALTPHAIAAVTDISQTPLLSATSTPVKPNVLFILDDSGSMASDYLPEAAGVSTGKYGRRAAQCNGLAFDPNLPYTLPVDSTGTSLAAASSTNLMNAYLYTASNSDRYVSFIAPTSSTPVSTGSISMVVETGGNKPKSSWYPATTEVAVYDANNPTRWMLGTVTSWDTSTARLVVSVVAASTTTLTLTKPAVGVGYPPVWYFTYSGSQTKLGWSYTSAGATDSSTTFYKECTSDIGSSPGSGVFTRRFMTLTDSNLQKFANWYQYYSTRMKMMQTVVGLAFKDIDDRFRVGYDTILNTQMTESSGTNANFLHVRDFNATQKSSFYTKLQGPKNSGWTPLRGAISNAGRYFANLAPGQDLDPVQYSCQKNFAILATDGAWNTNSETATYGPFALDGTSSVGQMDGNSARPLRDASAADGSGGSSDSLADVAKYYYDTDLRTSALGNCLLSDGSDACANNVPALGNDTANWQHLSTYTMSLGQNGTIKYDANYETQISGDFYDIKQGTKQWPNPTGSSDAPYVDDLWHAAVNGRGKYFNAADPSSVSAGLNSALSQIAQLTGSGSAAALSTLKPVAGNNYVYIARYTSSVWTGDLRAYTLDVNTGTPQVLDSAGNDLAIWSAAARLRANASRNIYYSNGSALRAFNYTNLTADGLASQFNNQCSALSHCSALSSSDQTVANNGATMVAYLRGTENAVYRSRAEMLGDIVGSSPVYVGPPPLNYSDSSYKTYKATQASRQAVLYVGANDGMLHAFSATTGDELWAFIPTAVRATMVKLADRNYGSNHRFFVDGTPVVADVYDGSTWRTILVGGLGAGGMSYYALDITNPNSPALLWEFSNTNLGYSFAQPVITKRSNGTWVVALSSGYNNVGDGEGRLFLLNAISGAKLLDLSTGSGSAASPSGLGPLSAWVANETDNTALRFYAGDTQGFLWRFDTEAVTPKAVKLAELKVGGKAQPITTTPQLAEIDYKGYKAPVVFVGTGKMLGLSDMSNADRQTIYAIKDNLGSTGLGDLRAGSTLVEQSLTTSGSVRTASNNTVDWTLKNGWFVDLPDLKERINVDMSLQFNTLVAASNIPQSVASCTPGGGASWLYYLDISNGSNTGTNVGVKFVNSLITGITAVSTSQGPSAIVNFFGQPPQGQVIPTPSVTGTTTKRASWRELVDR